MTQEEIRHRWILVLTVVSDGKPTAVAMNLKFELEPFEMKLKKKFIPEQVYVFLCRMR